MDSAVLLGAYVFWPQETVQVINSCHEMGKESLPFIVIGTVAASNELAYAASNFNFLGRYILDKTVRTSQTNL